MADDALIAQLPSYFQSAANIGIADADDEQIQLMFVEEEDFNQYEGDSDVEDEACNDHHQAMQDRLQARLEDCDLSTLEESVDSTMWQGGTVPNPEEIPIPKVPEDWVPPVRKVDKGEPPFSLVDNPGDWPQYAFRPEFAKDGTYKRHSLPTNAMPLPLRGTLSSPMPRRLG